MAQSTFTNVSIEDGLDLILSHLEPPYFPRRIATKMTGNSQILVCSREEALGKFIESGLLDCEISAYKYPVPTIRGINLQVTNFVDIDIDLKHFKTMKMLEQCLQDTLSNCRDKLGANPTVIWSGGGYHIPLQTC